MKMKISVIIPTFNRPEDLKRALHSIYDQSFSSDEYEILVVDNSKRGYAKEIAADIIGEGGPQIVYIHEPRTGLHYARHAGAKHGRGEILTYCDDDIIASHNWLEHIYSTFDIAEDGSIGAVGGRVIGKYATELPDWFGNFGTQDNCGALSIMDLGEGIMILDENQNIYGCNYSILRKVLYECGGFNPDVFYPPTEHYSGDGETGLLDKLRHKGYCVAYNSDAYVYHVIPNERLTVKYFLERYTRQGLSRAYTEYRQRRGSRIALITYTILNSIRYMMYLIYDSATRNRKRSIYYTAMKVYLEANIKHCLRIIKMDELRTYILHDTYMD